MNAVATVFLLVNAVALLLLPLRWAALPLLVGACYMTMGQGIELGRFNFPVIRILIGVGLVRVVIRGERLAGTINGLDCLMVVWAMWAVSSSVFHEDASATLVNRLGLVYNGCGIYFILRVFCRSVDDVINLCRIIAILLIPLSLEMLDEHMTGRNLFSTFGGVNEFSEARGGILRAQGPFAHPILAGSVGATCLPLVLALWKRHRVISIAGMAACTAMVYTSASSGPILSAGCAIAALSMWRWRHLMRIVRWIVVFGYVMLDLLMKAPAYFLLARMDMTGSSTSWHRAELIAAAGRHFSEWWMAGTDYTRHWMTYGVGWSGNHVDVTNYYIMMGIYGGLPLMLLFMAVLAKGFAFVGQQTSHRKEAGATSTPSFAMWGLGSALFAHAATFVSVSYFDQSVVFLYVTLAAICAGGRVGLTDADAASTTRSRSLPLSYRLF
jgi:hypothetical protein